MSVDMSSEAVTQRLRLLGQMWELGVSLKKAKPAGPEPASMEEESLSPASNTSNSEADGDIDQTTEHCYERLR